MNDGQLIGTGKPGTKTPVQMIIESF